jgi:Domain of unknown function (DUF5134)
VTGPSWLAGILAVTMIATAGYCASRLIIARAHQRRAERDVDLVHTVMGVAMAGMLVSWLNPLPDVIWAVMFGAGSGWFGWRAWRGRQHRSDTGDSDQSPYRHHVPHLVMCGAMVYMLLAAGAVVSATHPGMTMGGPAAAGRFPLLALVLAVFMVGYVMWQADRLPPLARASTPRATPPRTPALAVVAAGGGQATQPYEQATQAGEAAPDPRSRQQRWGMLPPRLVGQDNMPPLTHQMLSPHLTACCQIAMAVTMSYMLILML